ncbi:hypothetical protein KFE80_07035 [bacterium SCSIO 12696]|nr:hypothetical protein KFE80_07035 [bacterium SCSIO 12696]
MKYFFTILVITALAGCTTLSTVDTQSRNGSYYQSSQPTTDTQESLFSSDAVLSDQEISRILTYQLKLPNQSRLAILKLSQDNLWRSYSNDFNQLTDSMAADFISELRSSPRIYDASFLPSLLTPEVRTVPYLREAAARYQADLLLAYRTQCQTFQKYRVINPNITKAYCTVETVMLDVRTGIVPFTAVSTSEFSATKQKDDINFSETIKRAELKAVSESLAEVAASLKKFLKSAAAL